MPTRFSLVDSTVATLETWHRGPLSLSRDARHGRRPVFCQGRHFPSLPPPPPPPPQEVAELRRGSANFLAQRGQHARVVALLDSVRSRLSEVSFLPRREMSYCRAFVFTAACFSFLGLLPHAALSRLLGLGHLAAEDPWRRLAQLVDGRLVSLAVGGGAAGRRRGGGGEAGAPRALPPRAVALPFAPLRLSAPRGSLSPAREGGRRPLGRRRPRERRQRGLLAAAEQLELWRRLAETRRDWPRLAAPGEGFLRAPPHIDTPVVSRYGEIWGDMGRYGETCLRARWSISPPCFSEPSRSLLGAVPVGALTKGSSLPTIVSGRNSSQRPRSDASDGDHNSASPSPVPAAACLSLSLDGTAPPLLPALPPTAEALSRLEEETTRPARRLAFR